MSDRSVTKTLSANDVGKTGSHQAGITVPKQGDLLAFFPALDPATLNPDAWIHCTDDDGEVWKLRYVYYNNRLHVPDGTRNEYRSTHLTTFLRRQGAQIGDLLTFRTTDISGHYLISFQRMHGLDDNKTAERGVIKLRGWSRVH
jgi:hypothetical protein